MRFLRSIFLLLLLKVESFSSASHRRRAGTFLRVVEEEVDVIVIGAGVGGLSCAALTSKYGLETVCLEAHDTPGGCAHSFDRYSSASKDIPFSFDSGPSLVSGLSAKGTNPLRQVLDAVGTADQIDWKTYDGWIVHGKSWKRKLGYRPTEN